MDYELIVGTDAGQRCFENPSPELIEQAIDQLLPLEYNYVIIASEEAVDHCRFIQTTIASKKDADAVLGYSVEIQFDYGEAKFESGNVFTQYCTLMVDVDKVKRIFRMFVLGVLPDYSGWVDITQDIVEEIEARKAKEKEMEDE